MQVFQASIEQMLWPERRRTDDLFTELNITGAGVGWIQRTTADSYIRVPRATSRTTCAALLGDRTAPVPVPVPRRRGRRSGRFPQGTPVSLVTSMDVLGAELPEEQQSDAPEEADQRSSRQMKRELKRGNDIFASQQVMRDDAGA